MREKNQKEFKTMNWIKKRKNVSFLTIIKKEKENRKEENKK